ncbi:MAG: hypothetical protein ACLTMP_14785 [Eggerthella lenta]
MGAVRSSLMRSSLLAGFGACGVGVVLARGAFERRRRRSRSRRSSSRLPRVEQASPVRRSTPPASGMPSRRPAADLSPARERRRMRISGAWSPSDAEALRRAGAC